MDPWTPVEGRGHLLGFEAGRIAWLESVGLTSGVRTHVNESADALNNAQPQPRGVIRVRPASPAPTTEERFVLRDAE